MGIVCVQLIRIDIRRRLWPLRGFPCYFVNPLPKFFCVLARFGEACCVPLLDFGMDLLSNGVSGFDLIVPDEFIFFSVVESLSQVL